MMGIIPRETCSICFHVNRVGFSVPDKTWERIVPFQFKNSTVCLLCFTRLGDEKLIQWDVGIRFFPVSMKTHVDSK